MPFYNFDGCTGCHVCQLVTQIDYSELNRGRTPQEERIQQQRVNNQLEASESKDNDDSIFVDPDQAEDNKKEKEVEVREIIDDAPPEE